MKRLKSKSNLLLVMEDIGIQRCQEIHARWMIPYTIPHLGKPPSQEWMDRAAHYDASYNLIDSTPELRRRKMLFDRLMGWRGFE